MLENPMKSFLRRRASVAAARPARDLTLALVLKGALLLVLYLLFFGPSHRLPSGAPATAAALLGAQMNGKSR
jgi:hypothetical protein